MKKRILKTTGIVVLLLLAIVVVFLAFVTITEYKPDEVEQLEIISEEKGEANPNDTLKLIAYNIGYAALSQKEDFFMDGGKKVRPDNQALIQENLEGIVSELKELNADVYLLQEVDLNSKRTYYTNEKEYLEQEMGMSGIFAYNFNSKYVPYPFPTIGKVESGMLTLSQHAVTEATRISLPVPFSWPVSTCNLKRALLETRLPLMGSDKELVIINLHLEAYDDGEGKIKQTKMLMSKLEEEYAKGNYVIAGGDFNQVFEGFSGGYLIKDKDFWTPGNIEENSIPDGFTIAVDDSNPTSRLLNEPYPGNNEDAQVYVIDGFIVSPNVEVQEVKVIDTQFKYSDHQPVSLSVRLKNE